jgi:hypothetical protein
MQAGCGVTPTAQRFPSWLLAWLLATAVLTAGAACSGHSTHAPTVATAPPPLTTAAATTAAPTQAQAGAAAAPVAVTPIGATAPASGPAVSGSDLRQVVQNWTQVQSFRAHLTVEASGRQPVEELIEYVRPDRLHVSLTGGPTGSTEIIVIGTDTYTKTAGSWTKRTTAGSGRSALFSPDQVDRAVQQLVAAGVTQGGLDAVAGTRCQIYVVKSPTQGEPDQELCVSPEEGLLLRIVSQSGTMTTTVVFSDYNTPIAITPPP